MLLVRGRAAAVARLGAAPVPFEELISPVGRARYARLPRRPLPWRERRRGTAEYRYCIAAIVDASLFTDLGTVAGPRFSGLRWDRWFPTFGVGFRLFTPKGPHWEAQPRTGVQLAYAPDAGWRVMVSLAPF